MRVSPTDKRFVSLAVAGAVMAGIVWWGRNNPTPATDAAPPPPALGEVVARGRLEPTGRVLAIHGPAEGSVIHTLLVDQGDSLKEGQILATLDGYDIHHAELMAAERNLRLTELLRLQTTAAAKRSELAAQHNAVTAKEAQLTRLKKEWERRNALYEHDFATRQSLESLQAELDQAASEVAQASNTLKAMSETRGIDEEVAVARIEVEKAAVETARAQLEHMLVRAPVSGTVLSIQARAGEAIGEDGLLRMADLNSIEAVAEVEEVEAARVHEGMRAVIEAQILAHPIPGKVTRVSHEVFRQKRPASDVLIGRDAKIVEMDVMPDQPLPSVLGAEVLVRLSPEPTAQP